jgi:hypothetical protein
MGAVLSVLQRRFARRRPDLCARGDMSAIMKFERDV